MKGRCNQCWRVRDLVTSKECAHCRARRAGGGYKRIGRPRDLDARREHRITWTRSSQVHKLGGIPSSSTAGFTCPKACSLRGNGCYAEFGFGGFQWKRLSRGDIGISWEAFLAEVRALPPGQIWRHNLAGDLPGTADVIDVRRLEQLVDANAGRRGFTFTHKPLSPWNRRAIARANRAGLVVNLSAASPAHADELLELRVGPVVTVLAAGAEPPRTTPRGRKIVVCPSQRRDDVTCASCRLCADPRRETIIGFVAHGQMKRRVSLNVLQAGGCAA